MAAVHPTRVVRFTLLATLLAVSFPFVVEGLVKEYSTAHLITTIAFLINAVNFFHGKVVTLEDEEYNLFLTDRPSMALAEYFLNVSVILCFVFLGFFLTQPVRLMVTYAILRALDTTLLFITMSVPASAAVNKAQRVWLAINCGVLCVVALTLILHIAGAHPLVTADVYLVTVILDVAIDYSANWRMYFATASTWSDMAVVWDALQGASGDVYRRYVIVPELLKELGDVHGARILDVGCGNGCIARALSAAGARVTGVDNAPMVDKAAQYGGGVAYERVAGWDTEFSVGRFDAVVAVFLLQDCASLAAPLRFIRRHVAENGRALVIVENDEAFRRVNVHSLTRRRWLDSDRWSGKGRRQIIYWDPSLPALAPDALPESIFSVKAPSQASWTTITHHWSEAAYVTAASEAGLNLLGASRDLSPANIPADSEPLKYYAMRPRFRLMVFQPNVAHG